MSEIRGNKVRILEIDGKLIGYEEGETCNRLTVCGDGSSYQCDGTIELEDSRDCSCHISPPCNHCIARRFVCNECGECPAEE